MRLINLRRVRLCLATILGAMAVFLPMACKDTPPTGPQLGSLRISISTSGGDLDDGYELIVDSSQRLPISAYGSVILDGLSTGTHVVTLGDVAENCEVTGAHPLSVTVAEADTVTAIINVKCDVTGIQVTTRVTGSDQPAQLDVQISGGGNAYVYPNGSFLFSRIRPGDHTVTLGAVGENCTLTGSNSLTVSVSNRAVTVVTFVIDCGVTGVKITTLTTGVDLPASFDVLVSGAPTSSIPTSGSVVVSRLNPGSHTVSLGRLATNCRVIGDNPVTLEVTNRTVTPVAFEITCIPTVKRIAFVLDSVHNGVYTWILTADVDGSGITQLAAGYSPAWSADGARLMFSNAQCDYYYYSPCVGGLVFLDPDTHATTAPANGFSGYNPSLNPDGNLVAFSLPNAFSFYLAGLDGSPAVKFPTPALSAFDPTWSPDGQRIAFSCMLGQNLFEICAINKDGTGFTRLTNNTVFDSRPAWSPDGTRIAFVTQVPNGGQDIALVTVGGTEVTRLTAGFDPAWSPDGSRLVFAGADGLFTIRADGTQLTRLTKGKHRDPAWRP